MPGGLLQLKSIGDENIYINSNPEINFFKNVYMRHTNFVTNIIEVNTGFSDGLKLADSTKIKIRIPRNGDLIKEVFLKLDLPDIHSTTSQNFSFIKNIGSIIVKSAKLMIEENVIQELRGEYIYIYNKLYNISEKQDTINNLTGNTTDVYNPTGNIDNSFRGYNSDNTYNSGNIILNKNYNNKPTITGRTLYVPLPFWFTNNNGLSLPLISMKYHTVYIDLELRPIKELVKTLNIDNFFNDRIWNINPKLDVNYVFLDNIERNRLVKNNIMYLIEQVQYRDVKNISGKKYIEMQLYHPVKEMLLFARKNSINDDNEWTNFSDNGENIISDMQIFYDGKQRLEKKSVEYFTNTQHFIYHNNENIKHLLKYSFSLEPEIYQPTGICNFSEMHKIGFDITIKSNQMYDLFFIFINYNILDIRHGMAGVVYANN